MDDLLTRLTLRRLRRDDDERSIRARWSRVLPAVFHNGRRGPVSVPEIPLSGESLLGGWRNAAVALVA